MDIHIVIISEYLSVSPMQYKSMAFLFELRSLCKFGQFILLDYLYVYIHLLYILWAQRIKR
jgi:hypothetical protein